MESQCHTGLECTYNTVDDLGWRANIANHRAAVMIRDVLASESYAKRLGKGRVMPCQVVPESCVDCYGWSGDDDQGSGF
jgi:lipase ATG15